MRLRAVSMALGAFFLVGCLAPPPPIVVATPFGDVFAGSESRATEVAGLLGRLAPEVRAVLPGTQDRPVDIWVQEKLAVYRFRERPESVRGFTLLESEFEAKRIHLQEGGQSPWYLSHELVHALIGTDWAPLPGILEEGLGDVIAERLNPDYETHIRSHRLLNASAFTGGLEVELCYREPRPGAVDRRDWREVRTDVRLQISEPIDSSTLRRLLRTPRSELHERWADVPESFYGISWLIVSRIQERIGLEGLHALCRRATGEGLDLVPIEWIEEAAELDLDQLDARFLASCFDRATMQTALYLQPEPFARALLGELEPLRRTASGFRGVFRSSRPVLHLANGSEVPLGYYIGPLYAAMTSGWRGSPGRPVNASQGTR
jgi:hypothetical protein